MILSRTGQYGIRVALLLAGEGAGTFLTVRDLAVRCAAPYSFLAKICHRLTTAGILASQKGPHGGVALAEPATGITLLSVVEATGGFEGYKECVLGLNPCDAEHPCPLHEIWAPVKERMRLLLEETNLGDLAEGLTTGEVSLEMLESSR